MGIPRRLLLDDHLGRWCGLFRNGIVAKTNRLCTDFHQQLTPSQNNIDTNPPTTRTVKPQRAWVPSPSKLSLQVFWWGYRMSVNHFLSLHPTNHSHPHPQISSPTYPLNPKRQNSRRIHTHRNVKRNSILDFQWPINPSHTNTFSTFLMLLQGLYPFLGPISFFISWSWSWIMSYDIGELVLFEFSFRV